MAKNLRVLVVDDNREFCLNLADVLDLKDYEVSIANDGFEAIDKVKAESFDVVLMDVKMPLINGVETFKKLKEISPQTPVIMMTAYTVEELVTEALQEGAFGFIRKPIDFDKLFPMIENAVSADGGLILVVDDDEMLCDNLECVLGDKGFTVSVAYDGTSAIERVRENNFDIMLIDMKLPPVNGLETYLSARKIRPGLTAIIITGYPKDTSELIKKAIDSSAYTCLEKPLDMDELVGLLSHVEKAKAEGKLKKPSQ